MSTAETSSAVVVPAPRSSADGAVEVLPALYVPEERQWLSTSPGRVASDGYCWMQAVHWVAGSGVYEPRRYRSHGPRKFGPMTVYVAQLLAGLSPCRPGVAYLMRRTGLSERAVEYHLQMLRETGLLAWEVRGTRVRGEQARASEFARMVPAECDAALGIRTVGEGTGRRVTGIAETGRALIARLATKAARKVRKPRSRTSSRTMRKGARQAADGTVSGRPRCTPMGGGSTGVSPAGGTSWPPDSKLASGECTSPTPKKPKSKAGGRRKLNVVGRRYQLARELTEEEDLDWLHGCSVPRIAWVARHVADAGWTLTDVRGWLHLRGKTGRARRGSGLLAVLLAGAETVLDTAAKRASAVDQWCGAQEAERRHRIQQVRAHREESEGDWEAPASRTVRWEIEAAFAQVREAPGSSRDRDQGADVDDQSNPQVTEEEVRALRIKAVGELRHGETTLITSAIDSMGRSWTERIYGAYLVRRALQLASGARSSLMTYGLPAGGHR